MIVDRIITDAAIQGVYGEKVRENKNVSNKDVKTDKSSKASNTDAVKDNSTISPEAKKLQETEAILRFALQKIDDLENIRETKLQDVSTKIDSNYYDNPSIDQEVSEKIFSDESLDNVINKKKSLDNLIEKAKSFENNEIDYQKIQAVKEKLANGFYDQPNVIAETAEKLVENIL